MSFTAAANGVLPGVPLPRLPPRRCQPQYARVFVDVVSGKRFEPPGLAELIDHAQAGDQLCITPLDRLGRSLRELIETVVESTWMRSPTVSDTPRS